MLLIAAAVFVVALAGLGWRIHHVGIVSILPDAVLVRWAPLSKSPQDARGKALQDELEDRFYYGGMENKHRVMILKRWWADGGEKILIETRDQWPAGVPLRVRINAPGWFRGGYSRRLHVVPEFEGAQPAELWLPPTPAPLIYRSMMWCDETYEVGIVPEETRELSFHVSLIEKRSRVDDEQPPEELFVWEGHTAMPIRITSGVDDVITPVRSDELDDLMRNRLSLGIHRREWFPGVWCELEGEQLPTAAYLDDLTIGLALEFRHEDRLVAWGRLWWRCDGRWGTPWSAPVRIEGDGEAVLAAAGDEESWTVVVTGDGPTALRDFDSTQYWAGQYVIPLSEVERWDKER